MLEEKILKVFLGIKGLDLCFDNIDRVASYRIVWKGRDMRVREGCNSLEGRGGVWIYGFGSSNLEEEGL